MCVWGCSAAALAQECLHTHMHMLPICLCVYLLCVCVCHFCLQVQNELSQTTEKLHEEVAQRQQLLEECEQVAAIVDAISSVFFFLSLVAQQVD